MQKHLFDVFVWAVLMLCDRGGSIFVDLTDCIQARDMLRARTGVRVFQLHALLFSLQLTQTDGCTHTAVSDEPALSLCLLCVCVCVLSLPPMEKDRERSFSSRIWNMLMTHRNNNNPSSHMQREEDEKTKERLSFPTKMKRPPPAQRGPLRNISFDHVLAVTGNLCLRAHRKHDPRVRSLWILHQQHFWDVYQVCWFTSRSAQASAI